MSRLTSLCCFAVACFAAGTAQAADVPHSGFLPAAVYDQLSPVTRPSGVTAQQWVSPTLEARRYTHVIVDPVVYFPAHPQPTARVSTKLLRDLPHALHRAMTFAVARHVPVTHKVTPQTLRFKTAITAVSADTQGLKLREVLPIALAYSAVKYVQGERAQNATLAFEWQLRDAKTNALLAAGVRQGTGAELANEQARITLDSLKPAISAWAEDASAAFAPFDR